MTALAQESRFDLAPPQAPGRLAAPVLAIAAHALLLLALTFSVQWRHQTETPSIEAELWSKLPEVAAPRLEEPYTPLPEVKPIEPVPPVKPVPPPAPTPPTPPAPPKAQVAPPPPMPSAADIALEREKQKKIADDRRREELLQLQKQEQKIAKEKADKAEKARLARELLEREKTEKTEKDKLAKTQRDKLAKLEQEKLQKKNAEKKEAERKAEEKLLAEAREQDKRKKNQKDQEEKAKSAAETKAMEAQRQQNLKRMAGLAGASGEAESTGAAMRSSGPSASYGGRIKAKVKPNIVFTDDTSDNPSAEVEVKTAPDGTIVGRRLIKTSGNKAWDDAVIKALDKTEVLPRDTDGRVPSVMVIAFRLRD